MSLLSGLKLNAHQQILAALPSDLPDSFFCGPSDLNGTTLCSDSVVPGPGVRNPSYRSALMSGNVAAGGGDCICATVLDHDDTRPDSLIPSRMAAFSTLYASQQVAINDIKPIAAENKNARPIASLNVASISTPVVERPIIHVRKSNLDLTGRLVKRGALVSWHGFRGRVSRVRMGYLYPESNSPLHTNVGAWVSCNSVQVVG